MAMSQEPRNRELDPPAGTGERSALPRETLLWGGLVLLAALLRLVNLGAAPLGAPEANQALAAYVTSRGGGGEVVGPPLLYHLNTLLFTLFDGGDALARLAPALVGIGLILLLRLFRPYLGRWGALGAGLLLALSPTAVTASRTVDGTMLAAAGVMAMVGAAARFLETYRPRWIVFSGLGLAVALTSGPAAWGLLLGLLLALGVGLWIWRDELGWILPVVRPLAGRWLVAAGAGLLLLGGGLLLDLAGWAATGEQFLIWLRGFRPGAGFPLISPFALSLTYEPLILLAGLVGLVLAVRRLHGLGMLFTFWAAVGWVQVALRPGRTPIDLLWIVLPLAVLGGLAIQALVESLIHRGHWMNEGLHLLISLVLWVHFWLTLAHYTQPPAQPISLVLAGLVVVLQVLLAAAFGFAVANPDEGEPEEAVERGVRASLRAGGLSLGVALLVSTLATTWGVAHVRTTDPREVLLQEPTAAEAHLFTETVEQVSLLNTGALTGLPVTSLGEPDPVVAWTLRRHALETVEEVVGHPPLVVAPADELVPAGYFAGTFTLRREWTPPWGGLGQVVGAGIPKDAVAWWLYRETVTPPVASDRIALWVREDLGTAEISER